MSVLYVILTITLPWLGGLVVWGIGNGRPKAQHWTAIGFSLAAVVAALALPFFTTGDVVLGVPMGERFGVFTFIPDGLGIFLSIIATGVGSLAVIFSKNYMEEEPELGRYYSMVLLFIGAMAGLVLTGSLLALFLFWEITAFCSYTLIAFHNDDPNAVAGGIKALIITQVGGIGLLVGALAINAQLGSYQISDFLARSHELNPTILAFIAFTFLIAAMAKSAQVPLHTWLPDAMEAPTPVSALIHAATMVNAGVYLLIRFYPSLQGVLGWSMSVIIVGFLSALIGGVQACFTHDLKRALAYSTVSQLGYMVYAIGVGAIFASQFHLLNHSVFKALLFLSAGAVIHSLGVRDMREMGGLRIRMPFVFWAFLVGSLALAGIPFANGFFSKELILEVGFVHGPLWIYLGMLVATMLTAFYTVRMLGLVFYGPEAFQKIHLGNQTAMKISLGVLSLGALTTWILAGPFSQMLLTSLPYHSWHHISTVELVAELFSAPATWITLLLIALGAGTWVIWRTRGGKLKEDAPAVEFIQSGLGFEQLNSSIVKLTRGFSAATRLTQTGHLQWNLIGILGALFLSLCLIVLGA
jgi:NADH-quinone oxidoreductase subunit L